MKEELVTRPGVKNNGIIEILDPEGERKRIEYENAYINGKRYKIPERIIHLDFWSKIGRWVVFGHSGSHPRRRNHLLFLLQVYRVHFRRVETFSRIDFRRAVTLIVGPIEPSKRSQGTSEGES